MHSYRSSALLKAIYIFHHFDNIFSYWITSSIVCCHLDFRSVKIMWDGIHCPFPSTQNLNTIDISHRDYSIWQFLHDAWSLRENFYYQLITDRYKVFITHKDIDYEISVYIYDSVRVNFYSHAFHCPPCLPVGFAGLRRATRPCSIVCHPTTIFIFCETFLP